LAVAGDEGGCVDTMEISKPDDLSDIANLGLTLTEVKQRLARVQREISTAQARAHAVGRPVCPRGWGLLGERLSSPRGRHAVRMGDIEGASVSLWRVWPHRDRHQLAVALSLDTDTKINRDQTVDGVGRIETRTITVTHDVAWLQECHDWPGMKAVVVVESTRRHPGAHWIARYGGRPGCCLHADRWAGPCGRRHRRRVRGQPAGSEG
jgi:hypothetical protein